VVDSALASLVVDVKVLEVVVEVDATRAEVTAEQGSVGGEDGGDINVTLAAEGNGKASLPLVEVGNNGSVSAARRELWDALVTAGRCLGGRALR